MSLDFSASLKVLFIPDELSESSKHEDLFLQLRTLLPQSPYSPSVDSVDGFVSECTSENPDSVERKLLAMAVTEDKNLCGFAQFRFFGSDCDLDFIIIDENFRGKGCAKLLLERSFVLLKEGGVDRMILEVSDQNCSAVALYRRLGFNQISLRKNYYRDGEDALIMEKKL